MRIHMKSWQQKSLWLTLPINEVLPTLLKLLLKREIKHVSADGAYDTKVCYKQLQRKGCKSTTPLRSNAGFWEDGHSRDEAVRALKNNELAQWKKENDY